MIRRVRSSTLIMCLIITLFTATAHAQITQSDNSVPYRSISPQVESTIEKTATIALRHVAQARSEIHRNALAKARNELSEAVLLMETIKDDLSTATAKNLIRIARKHLEYEQPQEMLHDLALIQLSLEKLSVYIPTDKARLHIDKAKSYLENKDKRGADRELALADGSLVVVEVDLPLSKAQWYVAKAREYLASGKPKRADKALRMAEQRAATLYTSLNSPLSLAKQNLWLAFRNYSTARHAEVAKHLKQARDYLGMVATGGSEKVNGESGKFSQEVTELEKKLTDEVKVAESDLKAAWEKSEALAERSVAYWVSGLSEAETTLRGENSLIEARLHVVYAETYQVTTAEPAKAARELDAAVSYLQKAAASSLAGPTDSKKIHEMVKSLLVLKANPEKKDAAVLERYAAVKAGLDSLIQKI